MLPAAVVACIMPELPEPVGRAAVETAVEEAAVELVPHPALQTWAPVAVERATMAGLGETEVQESSSFGIRRLLER